MHNGALKKWALALTFWLALHVAPLRAQLLGPYGSSPITFEVDANGLLSATGTFGTGSLSLSGTGTRMFWYPGKAAFRAGGIGSWPYDSDWDDAHIGPYSVAFGMSTTASGYYSAAFGINTESFGSGSFAAGGGCGAQDDGATAMGGFDVASARNSTVFGIFNTAEGTYSTASGAYNTASGYASTALGAGNTASAPFSSVSGLYNTSSSYVDFVVGFANVGGGTSGSWVETDPLFEVGNGSHSGYGNPEATGPADAFVVYKGGNAAVQGVLTVSPGGDIPMFTGD